MFQCYRIIKEVCWLKIHEVSYVCLHYVAECLPLVQAILETCKYSGNRGYVVELAIEIDHGVHCGNNF